MDRTNAERQRRYIARLKAAAAGAAPKHSVTNGDAAGETSESSEIANVINSTNSGAAGEIIDPSGQGTRAVQPQAARPADVELPRQRVITVRRPGVVPQGPNEISHEQWHELGCSVERLKEFLRQRSSTL